MTDKEALKLALEALKMCRGLIRNNIENLVPIESPNPWFSQDVDHAIISIREALAQAPTEQEQPAQQQDIPDLIAGTLGVSRGTAYDMMREALAEAQQQEPVVRWVCKGCRHEYMEAPSSCDCMESTEYERVEYFTSPPASKPLTNEEISRLNLSAVTVKDAISDVREVEAAHGIKGDA